MRIRKLGYLSLLIVVACTGDAESASPRVDFEKQVMGLMGRTGCNLGACHGSFQGKGGFYLSLFGYSPDKDFQALTRDAHGRRINRVYPEESLLLLKATGQMPHGGGVRFPKNSPAYYTLLQWIKDGAEHQRGSGDIKSIKMEPAEFIFNKANDVLQLKILAEFTDGTKLDVTEYSDFRILDDYIAELQLGGAIKGVRPGDTVVVGSYRGNVLTSRVILPVVSAGQPASKKVDEFNFVDKHAFSKLRKLKMEPSDLSSDSEFLRRVTIDTIGQLPNSDEVREFLADKSPDKRTRKVDQLLRHPLHAALWATKFSDITSNNTDLLELPITSKPRRSKMWHDWLRKRFQDNTPYDQLVKGILTATSRDGKAAKDWATQAAEIEIQSRSSLDTAYANRDSLDLFWRRVNTNNMNFNFTIEQMAELTASAFMGVRIECAQCHKHPFDRWTQTDYRQYANIFSQVKLGVSPETKAVLDEENKRLAKINEGLKPQQAFTLREIYADNTTLRRLPHPDTNDVLQPKPLGAPADFSYEGDCREKLFQWLIQPDNPYFARSFVNRVWAHYFGLGLVEPVDSFSAANPPSNPELMDSLAAEFVRSKFDIRYIERVILLSRTYQLSALPTESNKTDKSNYSHSFPRRMMAEVMVDVLNSALGATDNYGTDVPAGARAIEIAQSRFVQNNPSTQAFRVLGRPTRVTSCDCERSPEPALPQTLYFMTDQQLLGKIGTGKLAKNAASKGSDKEIVEELFLSTLCRIPNADELKVSLETIKDKGRGNGIQALIWSLINTREFVLNH